MSSNPLEDGIAEYDKWRVSRWEEIAGPEGKAQLAVHEPITGPDQVVPDVPGRWNSTGVPGSLRLTVAVEEGVLVGGQPVDGTVELTIASRLTFPGGRRGTIEEMRGSHVLAVWDPSAPTSAGLRGIAAYPWDARWITEAEYRPAEAGRNIEVTRTTSPPVRDVFPAAGDLVLDLEGERHILHALVAAPGILLVPFTDGTSGADTPAMGRWLILPTPTDGSARVDFNRAVLPHHVFSAAFPCPLPPDGNHLPLRIEAGERAPDLAQVDDGAESSAAAHNVKGNAMTSEEKIRDTAIRYLRQWEVRDYAGMRSMCTNTATVWHSDGSGEQTIDENMELLKQLAADVDTLRYDIVRQFHDGDQVLQQQVLHLTMTDGSRSDVHAAMYFRFDDGLIDRIEEYFNVVPIAASTPRGRD